MTPAQLSRTVLGAVGRAVADGELAVPLPGPEAVTVERTRGPDRGDYGTGIALKLARPAGKPPRQVARIIARRLEGSDGIVRVDVAGPGFLNIHLAATAHADLVRTVRALGTRYGHGDSLATAPPVPVTDPRSAACDRLLRACGAPTAPSATNAPTAPSTADVPATAPAKSPAPLTPLGPDATAWALVRPPAGDPPDLTPATHLVQRAANPLFRIRYAHARARALLRNARDLGFGPEEGAYDYALPAETALLGVIADHPRVVESAARHHAPDRLARALEALADAFFDFHDGVAVLPRGDEKPSAAHRARLALADAAGTVLAGGLSLLGISAPEHL